MTPSLLVHAFEIGVTQQARTMREINLPPARLDTLIRCFGHTGGHSASGLRYAFAIVADADGCVCATLIRGCLFSKTWLHRDPLAPLGAAAGQYFLAALGLHARAKPVFLASLAPVGLECTLGHEKSLLLISSMVLGQTVSINQQPQERQAERKV